MARSTAGDDWVALNATVAAASRAVGDPADPSGAWSDEELHRLRADATATIGELLGNPPALDLTSSCTHAMEAAAVVLGLGHGDEVVVPAFTFPSTANAFLLGGATIRFADVDEATGSLDPASVERIVGPRTRAVVCTHYGGVAPDMGRLAELQRDGGWELVEDAAHGLFASYRGTPLGRFGAFGALSFHRTKNISAIDGGALVVNRPDLVERAVVAIDKGTNRAAFERGAVTSYEWSGPGSAWRLGDPMLPALAAQLERRDQIQAVRHHVWNRYRSELADWAERVGAALPLVPDGCEHPAHLFWLVLPAGVDRAGFTARCASRGVQVARHYGSLPDSSYGQQIRHPDDRCPRASALGERLVRLPLHHQLDDHQVDRVIDAVTAG